MGPNYDPDDGLPTYICGADAFGSYFTLQQMQMSGKDIEHGFHLGIVPFFLDDDPAYDVSEEQRTALLNSGQWDCLLTTLDSVALKSPGVITAIVDESAGADQLWARDIETINDLKGKRIAFSRGSVGEYFVYYALSIAQLSPRSDVTLRAARQRRQRREASSTMARPMSSPAGNQTSMTPKKSGGLPLLSSNQLRIVMDVIVTSRQSIDQDADLVQSFHNAWFDTLKAQVEDFDTAAQQIADWGHNDWSFIYPETATRRLGALAGKRGAGRPGRQRLRHARHTADAQPPGNRPARLGRFWISTCPPTMWKTWSIPASCCARRTSQFAAQRQARQRHLFDFSAA